MKRKLIILNILTCYYLLTYVFHFFKLQSFIKDVFIAPLFFLVPTGLGLLIFSLFSTHKKLLKTITGLQLMLSGTFLGLLMIALIYTELNNHNLLSEVFIFIYPPINILSLLGFYRIREHLNFNDTFKSPLNTFLILSPLCLIVYYYLYIHFSPFPLRDIFMETHFIKGALEFSKYNIINPATGSSYFALLQVHSGLLHHYFNYNLLNSQWIMPAYIFAMYFLCFYCFYSSFINDRFILTAAMGLNTIFTSLMFSNSNNSYLIMLSVLFFSVLVSRNRGQTRLKPLLAELSVLCALSMIFFLNREFPSYEKTLLLYLISYLVLMIAASLRKDGRFIPVLFLILLELIAPPYHRAASLYIPLMITLYAMYFICFQWDYIGGPEKKRSLLNKILISSLLCTPFIVGIEIMITTGWPTRLMHKVHELINPLFLFMVNQRVSDNQGIVGTTAEFVRFVPPLVFVVFALIASDMLRSKNNGFTRKFIENNFNYITFCALSILFFIMFYYSPLPNIHRLLVFPVLMIFALMALLLKYYYENYLMTVSDSKAPLLFVCVISLYTLITKFTYDLPWKYPDITSPYIAELTPITQIGWSIIAISLLIMLITRKAAMISLLTVLILISGLFLDRFNMVTKLYGNGYGYEFPEPKTISHYTHLELATAEQLEKMIESPDNLMISDPFTLGIFEARTGINGFYTFANLGQFMLSQYTNDLKAIFKSTFPDIKDISGLLLKSGPLNEHSKAILPNEKNLKTMLMVADFSETNKGAIPEADYTIQDRLGIPFDIAAFTDKTSWATTHKKRFFWIISEKTIRWAYGDVGYYPMNTPFSESYIESYIRPYFDVVINSENTILVLKLK